MKSKVKKLSYYPATIASGVYVDNSNVTLQDLVNYGYLKGNGTKDNKMEIINPKDNKNIGACSIAVKNENGKLTIEGSCPKEDN